MLKLILWVAGIVAFAYWKRHGFRRAWYILRTDAEDPDWEKLGGDYFIGDWKKRGPKNAAVKEEAKVPNVSE